MAHDLLRPAQEEFSRGLYATALHLARNVTAKNKVERDDKDCLICECLQFTGDFGAALRQATSKISEGGSAEHVARYWQVVGRTELDRMRREEATEGLRQALRSAHRTSNLSLVASVQQLWLVAAGETLGNGLATGVRDAYQTAVRSADPAALAGFHLRLSRIEGQRGAFAVALHHLSLAKSILDRSPHVALKAIYQVNMACILDLAGSYDAARHAGEEGAALAEQAGYARLVMAAAATTGHAALCAGDTSVAEAWLRKAKKASQGLGIVDISQIDNLAAQAVIAGDLQAATKFFETIRNVFGSREYKWSGNQEVLTLFTEMDLHRRLGNREGITTTLEIIKTASQAINDQHSQLLAAFAEVEIDFDEGRYVQARGRIFRDFAKALHDPVYLPQLDRVLARSLWLDGRRASARRMLGRACTGSALRGTRVAWSEALKEMRDTITGEPWESAYSLNEQLRQAEAKFAFMMTAAKGSWYQSENTQNTPDIPRDPVDGFDDALGILLVSADPVLRGREALASALSLGVVDQGALLARTDAGLRKVASAGIEATSLEQLAKHPDVEKIDIGRTDRKSLELLLLPKKDLRSAFAVTGIRRLLDAAAALESQRRDQQRVRALWNPDIIVEEADAVFSSPQTIELMQAARKIAPTSLPVLLMGDTGTGKEVLARAIHRASGRANKIFLPFNCSAVPRDMIESQLFGSRRGAFTGSHEDLPGIIRSAEGGTLFLDEIGELSMDLQPKLLRFLETNEVHPLGEGKPIKVDVRVIAATNADLDSLIQLKQFREDLYYRLNIVRFVMPQLCERREEIPPLATHLLRRFEMDEKKHSIKLSDELMEYLLLYKWPGNVRQLSNELRKMVAMVNSGEVLTPEHLAPAIRATRKTVAVDPDAEPVADEGAEASDAAGAAAATPPAPPAPDASTLAVKLDQPLPGAVEALERAMIDHAMTRAGGHIEEAARLLGISRKGLFLKRRRWQNGSDPSHPS